MSKLLEYLDFAKTIARDAQNVILPIYEQDFDVELKDDHSPVTDADRAAEKRMRARIAERYPEHAVLGEEFGWSGPQGATTRWIVDPVDGTLSLTRRVPLFGTLVAVTENDKPVVGVANFPVLGQIASAAHGHGAWFDGQQMSASNCDSLDKALLCTTGLHATEFDDGTSTDGMGSLLKRVGQFRGWGDCFGHVMVAAGRADAMVDTVMKPWDNAALLPILWESGAKASTVDGREEDLVNGGSLVSASPAIHADVIAALHRATP